MPHWTGVAQNHQFTENTVEKCCPTKITGFRRSKLCNMVNEGSQFMLIRRFSILFLTLVFVAVLGAFALFHAKTPAYAKPIFAPVTTQPTNS